MQHNIIATYDNVSRPDDWNGTDERGATSYYTELARSPSLQPLAWHRLLHCKRASNPPRRPSLRLPGGGGGGDGGDGGPLFKPDKGAAS